MTKFFKHYQHTETLGNLLSHQLHIKTLLAKSDMYISWHYDKVLVYQYDKTEVETAFHA